MGEGANGEGHGNSETEVEGPAQVLGKWKGYMANNSGEPDSPINLEFTKDNVTAMRFSGQVMGTGTYRIRSLATLLRDKFSLSPIKPSAPTNAETPLPAAKRPFRSNPENVRSK